MVIPAPSAPVLVVIPFAIVIFKSSTSSVAVFSVVVVPFTVRLPVIVASPPTDRAPVTCVLLSFWLTWNNVEPPLPSVTANMSGPESLLSILIITP